MATAQHAAAAALPAALLCQQMQEWLHDHLQYKFWPVISSCYHAKTLQHMEQMLLSALQALQQAASQQQQHLSQLCQQILLQCAAPAPLELLAALMQLLNAQQHAISTLLLTTAPVSLTGLLQHYYQGKLAQLCQALQQAAVDGPERAASPDVQPMESDQEPLISRSAPSAGFAQSLAAAAAAAGATSSSWREHVGEGWGEALRQVGQHLQALGLGPAGEEAYTLVITRHVEQQLQDVALQVFDRRVLPLAEQLACQAPLLLLGCLLGVEAGDGTEEAAADMQGAALRVQEWRLRVSYMMLETLACLRTREMFDLVVDYPDSQPAVEDLAVALKHTNMAGAFCRRFQGALQARLLHAGATTADIITTYVSTIRALKQMDPSGALLEVVSAPIQAYLRSRPDTIRCVVSMLTEDGSVEGEEGLSSELGLSSALLRLPEATAETAPGGGGRRGFVSEAEGDDAALKLLEGLAAGDGSPDVLVSAADSNRGDPDIVATLINIYGSQSLFIEEYRVMLAARLLSKDYDCERDIHTLELLKIRFGESDLMQCEVMIKDMADSKRMDVNVHQLQPSQVSSNRAGGPHGAPPHAGAAAAGSPGTPPGATAGGAGSHGSSRTQNRPMPGAPLRGAAMVAAVAGGSSTSPQYNTRSRTGGAAGAGGGGRGGAAAAATAGGDGGGGRGSPGRQQQQQTQRMPANPARLFSSASAPQAGSSPAAAAALATPAGGTGGEAAAAAAAPAKALSPAVAAALSSLHATICSHLFWPELQQHELHLPPDIETALEVYAERYHHLKAPRRLKWRPTLGCVTLDVTLAGQTYEFKVTSLHATLLLAFCPPEAPGSGSGGAGDPSSSSTAAAAQQLPAGCQLGDDGVVQWSAAALAEHLGVQLGVVRDKAAFWVGNGLLQELRGAGGQLAYRRATSIADSQTVTLEVTDTSWPSTTATAADQVEAALQAEMGPYENYILGLLTNFGSLALERMHHLLKVFVVSEPRYVGKSQEQLAAFLNVMVGKGTVVCDNGLYKKK